MQIEEKYNTLQVSLSLSLSLNTGVQELEASYTRSLRPHILVP
jgi:hypothetical protein